VQNLAEISDKYYVGIRMKCRYQFGTARRALAQKLAELIIARPKQKMFA